MHTFRVHQRTSTADTGTTTNTIHQKEEEEPAALAVEMAVSCWKETRSSEDGGVYSMTTIQPPMHFP